MSRRCGLGKSIPATWQRPDTLRFGVPERTECRAPARPAPDALAPYSSSDEHDYRGCARAGEPPRPQPGATKSANARPHHAETSTVPFSIALASLALPSDDEPGRRLRNDTHAVGTTWWRAPASVAHKARPRITGRRLDTVSTVTIVVSGLPAGAVDIRAVPDGDVERDGLGERGVHPVDLLGRGALGRGNRGRWR